MLLLLGTRNQERTGRQAGEQQHERSRVGVLGDLLDGDGQPEDPGTGTAVRLRDAQTGETGLHEEFEEVLGVLLAQIDLARTRRDLLLGELADTGLKLLQLRRKVEIHEESSLPGASAHLGFVPGGSSDGVTGRHPLRFEVPQR